MPIMPSQLDTNLAIATVGSVVLAAILSAKRRESGSKAQSNSFDGGDPIVWDIDFSKHQLMRIFDRQPIWLRELLFPDPASQFKPQTKKKRVFVPPSREELAATEQRLNRILRARREFYFSRLKRSESELGPAVELLMKLRKFPAQSVDFGKDQLVVGDESEISKEEQKQLEECLREMIPWKKGPMNIFGIEIDSEWRSDLKWQRLKPHVDLKGKAVCDLGCGNGYFMFRMLEQAPRVVVGIDPNMKAFTEYALLQHYLQRPEVHFEVMDGDIMDAFQDTFDVVFCLGVLYHTPDPIGMLRKIWLSMRKGSLLVVDCQGIAGDEPLALFPRSRYANMKGVWFLPTLPALLHWLARANFRDAECFYSAPLSTEEQRATPWAPIKSLADALDPATNNTKTIEGYAEPHRFYVKCKRY